MKLGEIIVNKNGQAELVFIPDFMLGGRVLHIDVIQDLMGDLSELHEKLLKEPDMDFSDYLNELDDDDCRFVIQRALGVEFG